MKGELANGKAGDTIMRIGRYVNVDEGAPLIKDGRPPHPRSIGGDEVAIMHTQMLTVHTDRRLFIGDLGNACIRSVKLDYHREAKVPLKDLAGGPEPEASPRFRAGP